MSEPIVGTLGAPIGGPNGDPGDPGCSLTTLTWLPTDGSSGPWPALIMCRANLFRTTGFATFSQIAPAFQAKGYIVMGFLVRVMVGGATGGSGIPNQTTDGRFSQQTNDVAQAIRFMRADSRCNGFVEGLGGSGSGGHMMYKALVGTPGDDLLDAAICLSPVMDCGDRESDVDPTFINVSCDYYRQDPDDNTQPTLDIETALSPLGHINVDQPPIWHYNGGLETMPASQLQRTIDKVALVGAQNYVSYFVPESDAHSFHAWGDPIAQANVQALIFTDMAYSIWQGGGGGEPPPPPPPTREFVTVEVTGLSPGILMTAHVNAVDKTTGLAGPIKDYEFFTDRDLGTTTLKDAPEGNYVYVPAPGGIPGSIDGRPWLDFDYVDGARLDTNAAALFSNKRFDWSVVQTFLNSLTVKNKFGGICVATGITTPQDWYRRGVRSINLSGGGQIPLPWDEGYLQLTKKMIIDFSAIFNALETLQYVVLGGLGQAASTFLVGNADYAALNDAAIQDGFISAAEGWNFGAQKIATLWLQGCFSTRCFVQVDYPVPPEQGGLEAISDLIDYLITNSRGRFGGVLSAKLTGATDGSDPLDALIQSSNNRLQTGYAFAFPSTDPNCDPTQDPDTYDAETGLRNTAFAGINLGVAFEEYKESDILTTTAPYPADFDTFQTSLKNNSNNP